jgi:hypothetical protein
MCLLLNLQAVIMQRIKVELMPQQRQDLMREAGAGNQKSTQSFAYLNLCVHSTSVRVPPYFQRTLIRVSFVLASNQTAHPFVHIGMHYTHKHAAISTSPATCFAAACWF